MKVSEKEIQYGNVLVQKSFGFAKRIVNSYKILSKRENSIYPILKQLLRCGNSIGANISEAQSAFSKKDFINKLGISLKESKETDYWLRLLYETDEITKKEFESLKNDNDELLKLLTSIIKSSKISN